MPALVPGQVWHITIEMVSPSEPGVHQTKWRMMTSGGSYFGGKQFKYDFMFMLF